MQRRLPEACLLSGHQPVVDPPALDQSSLTRPRGFVDVEDSAAVAVHALTDEHAPSTDLVLTGPEALSYDDIAATITQVTGRPVDHQRLAYEQMRDRLMAQVPAEFASILAGMDRAIAEGVEDRVTDTVQRLTGRPARTFHALLEREME